MEQRFALGQHGRVTAVEDGPRVTLTAELADDGRGLYKVYLVGASARMLLGTLVPEGGLLRLARTLTLDALRRQGVWPLTGAEVDLAFPFQPQSGVPAGWVREYRPGQLLGDGLLVRAAEGLTGALSQRLENGFRLALPYAEKGAFGLTPLFCFAQIERLSQRTYAVFDFNGRGCPVFPAEKRSG